MTKMQRLAALTALSAFLLLGIVVTVTGLSCDDAEPLPAEPVGGGGWFCCDLAGNCVWITSQNTQDCGPSNTVKWCKKVSTNADGTKVCSQWGE
jgi:hypothetical protein